MTPVGNRTRAAGLLGQHAAGPLIIELIILPLASSLWTTILIFFPSILDKGWCGIHGGKFKF
jgi:hypothetical protein